PRDLHSFPPRRSSDLPVVQPTQVIVSVVSGVSCADVKAILGQDKIVVRAMPNTAIAIGQSMTCIASDDAPGEKVAVVERLFEARSEEHTSELQSRENL